jgi:hypothetical protein
VTAREAPERGDHVVRAEPLVGVEADRVDRRRWVVLVRAGPGHAQDPRGVRGRQVGSESVREPPVRPLQLVTGQWLTQRPVGVTVAAGTRRDNDRRGRLEALERGDGVLAVAVGPQHERVLDRVAAAVAARARSAADIHVGAPAEKDRARRQPAQPRGALEELPHPHAVVEPVAQLDKLVRIALAGERGEEPCRCLVPGEGRGAHGVHREVVRPAAGAAPRARDGGQALWWASRAAPSVAGSSVEASPA